MNQFRNPLAQIPTVTRNLIIVNVIFFVATYLLEAGGTNLVRFFGLYYPASGNFVSSQFFTYMFMHGGFFHILMNMYALYMFGRILESVWGPKRYLLFYIVTGVGAALFHTLVNYIQIRILTAKMPQELVDMVFTQGTQIFNQGKNFTDPLAGQLNLILNIPTVGASGAVFGLLLGFGMLFPNTELYLMFVPVPIKAKYFVIGYGLLELYQGFAVSGSNIAHFAHLGGMIFGFILIKYWNKKSSTFY
ncbi:MAG: rhomboid family intramembrane serine protease [Prolixibacteraceae bacterium]|jgi:membrane associated rhomboid family serine protease|nr:rhomboid family intramembrane serine protease [Prolixibacteraceae bacterium]